MINSYLITLTPTGKFFFGGEMTFKVKGEGDDYNEQYSSYIISSNKMPQQTSLLGMLRFLLLRNAGKDVFDGNKIQSREKAANLIGQSSFKVSANHEAASFGKIESITPCFLMEGNDPVPVYCKITPEKFDMAETVKAKSNSMDVYVPQSSYNPKDNGNDPLEGYFKEDQRIGLNKDYEGKKKELKKDETDLFKQINYRLNESKDLKFAFYANVDSSIPMSEYNGQLVTLGADSSSFVISITPSEYKEMKAEVDTKNICVILSSPAFIEIEKLDCIAFATTSVIPFRFLCTTVHTESYNRLNGNKRNEKKYNLYDTGSVFYFDSTEKMDKFAKALDNYKDFRQIGYNYYIDKK